MKKILFVASVYTHLSAFHKPFMKLFQNKGYEVHAVGSNSLGRKDELIAMGIVCHDVEFDRLPFSKKNLKALKKLEELFRSMHYEMIHVHTPTAAFLTRYVADKHNQGKILYTAHGFHFFSGAPKKNWMLFYPAEKIAVRWTDGLIVMNEEDYELGKRLGYQENKNIFNVHGVGVDLIEFDTRINQETTGILNELRIDEDAVVVSCIAELSSRKNQKFLLDNWRKVTLNTPNIHLLLIGNGPDYEEIKEFISNENFTNIHLLGYRRDVPEIIAQSDIVTLVSKQEGLPRCLMEAMACGKSIIATNVRGSRDLVDHDSTGKLVDLGDNENLVNAFSILVQNKEIRKVYGEAGQRKIQNYSIETVLKEMDVVYSEFL
ncbi:glycosyltransferase family 4 protein [Psychrobacillus sp. L3]|uniref:glycosyltransferase family 4 protein n=1 Tax=Psychrobacillus sp. L3 TaxID=3236891 RepID=UPI0036F32CB8